MAQLLIFLCENSTTEIDVDRRIQDLLDRGGNFLFVLINTFFFNFILLVSGYKSKNNWRQNTFNDYLLEKQRRQCYWWVTAVVDKIIKIIKIQLFFIYLRTGRNIIAKRSRCTDNRRLWLECTAVCLSVLLLH